MRLDARVHSVAEPIGANVNKLRHLTREEISAMSMSTNLYVKKSGRIEYPDYIEHPVMLLSEKLKKIMSKYQKDAIFKTVILIDKDLKRQKIYYLISAPCIDCAAEETTYDARGNVKELVIDQEKVGHARIFFAEKNGQRLLVRLDVAESILRRDANGVWFERVRVTAKERGADK